MAAREIFAELGQAEIGKGEVKSDSETESGEDGMEFGGRLTEGMNARSSDAIPLVC